MWRNHVPNDPRSDEEIKAQEVDKFRRLHPAQTRFMYDLDAQALRCVRYREPVQRKRHSFEMDGDTLILRLPSGRPLFYPRAHIKRGKFGKDVVAYHAANKNREVEMWYGAWLANLVSATARDLLVNALFNLDAAGFDIVLHVHDEIVAEVDPANVERDRERFKACMLAGAGLGRRSAARGQGARRPALHQSRRADRDQSTQHRSSQRSPSSSQLRFRR